MSSFVQSKSKAPPKLFKCEKCDKTFGAKRNLNRHKRTHDEQLRAFVCTLCTFPSHEKKTLTNHIRTHTKEKPLKCQYSNCPAAFAQLGTLNSHQLVHRENEETLPTFECPRQGCLYKTIYKSAIGLHLRKHSDARPFACDLCPYRAKFNSSLKAHHKNIHSTDSEKTFKCPQSDCNYSNKNQGLLTQHIKTHSDEKPFVCSFSHCTYRSRAKALITKHELIHRGEKPFKCSLCPYTCRQKGHLVTHTRVHTGETPYACKICPFQAKHTSHVSRHIKIHHSGKPSDRGHCKNVSMISPGQGSTFKCKVANCDYTTGENSSLAIHLTNVHNLPRIVLKHVL